MTNNISVQRWLIQHYWYLFRCTMTHQHDDNVCVSVISELPQPPLHILVGEVLGCNGLRYSKTEWVCDSYRYHRRGGHPLHPCSRRRWSLCTSPVLFNKILLHFSHQISTLSPAVSQIWAFMVFPSTWMDLVANSTPMVDLDSRLNSFLVNLESKFDLPTPESPMRTTGNKL